MSWDKYDWYLDEDNNGGFSGSACSGSNTSGECFDNLGYQYRNCTSYVAQKIYQIFGVRIAYWGSAEHWETAALAANYTLDPTNQPRVGDIAQWDTEAGGGSGHVAYVYAVASGVASLAEYNSAGTGQFSSIRTTASSSAGVPDHYIHIGSWGGVGGATYRLNYLPSGSTLYPNQYLESENDQSALVFQNDSNLVLYSGGRALWQSGTAGQGGTRLVMQTDGNLVMYRADNSVAWQTGTNGRYYAYAILQADGNFIINDDRGVYWWSGTGGHAGLYYTGYDRLQVGYKLLQNQYLRSADNRYALLLQADGNLVLYGPGYHVLWSAGVSGADHLTMQTDGNLVLYAGSKPLWWSGTSGANNRLVVQNDGNLVEYNSNNTPLWFSRTEGQI
jgi:surface antigen